MTPRGDLALGSDILGVTSGALERKSRIAGPRPEGPRPSEAHRLAVLTRVGAGDEAGWHPQDRLRAAEGEVALGRLDQDLVAEGRQSFQDLGTEAGLDGHLAAAQHAPARRVGGGL